MRCGYYGNSCIDTILEATRPRIFMTAISINIKIDIIRGMMREYQIIREELAPFVHVTTTKEVGAMRLIVI